MTITTTDITITFGVIEANFTFNRTLITEDHDSVTVMSIDLPVGSMVGPASDNRFMAVADCISVGGTSRSASSGDDRRIELL